MLKMVEQEIYCCLRWERQKPYEGIKTSRFWTDTKIFLTPGVTFELVKRLRGKVKILREFYNDNKDRFFGYLLRRTGDYQLAADTLQESFARYLERYSKNDPSVSLLFTIGRNILNDNFRSQRNTIPFEEDRHNSVNDLESACQVREESRRVLKAIQQLDPDEADVLSLVVTSGLSYRKIAKLTGTTEANIKVKIHRSRLKLKKILQTGES